MEAGRSRQHGSCRSPHPQRYNTLRMVYGICDRGTSFFFSVVLSGKKGLPKATKKVSVSKSRSLRAMNRYDSVLKRRVNALLPRCMGC